MSGINKVILIGNLGQDPEFKQTQGGRGMLKLRVAVSEKWKDNSGEQQERTEWVSCTMWGKRAEALSRFLGKGQQVYVEGRMQTRKWQDKEGNDRSTTEINVTDVQLLGGKRDGSSGGGSKSRDDKSDYDSGGDGAGREGSFGDDFADDDIPFATTLVVTRDFARTPKWERF